MFKTLCLPALIVLMSAALSAQVAPPGEGPWRPAPVWFGAELSTFNPDYFCQNSSPFSCWSQQKVGVSTFIDMNRLLLRRVGAEGEARFLHWSGSGLLSMTNYLAGPRVELVEHKGLALHGKFLVGDGSMTLHKGLAGSGHFFVLAPGIVAEYRLAGRVTARAEYEYQRWPSFKGTGTGKGGLTPNGLSFGLSYLILR